MSAFPPARTVALPARPGQPPIELAVHEQGEGPAVVLCHGFPELAYSWRHQLPAVAGAGFRAIAPNQRGYPGSSQPEAIDQYGLAELTGDLVGLLDALDIDKAVFVGHDWGGFVAWAMPLLYPERCLGIVGVCTPYVPFPGIDVMRMMVGGEDERVYFLWFQQPGVAEAVLDARTRKLFDVMLRAPMSPAESASRMLVDGKIDMNPFRRLDDLGEPETELIVTEEELEVYVKAFESSGFRGGINWYRNIDRNSKELPQIGTEKLKLPCLMITAEWDAALRPELAGGMPALCSDLEIHQVAKGGHWVQQEKPDDVNGLLTDWLRRRFQ